MDLLQALCNFVMLFGVIAVCALKASAAGKEKKNNKRRRNGNIFSFEDSSEPSPRKKHSGKCDGDCANCPPHYGYRYGRWYYGHDHSEGCEFGGNKCGGGK